MIPGLAQARNLPWQCDPLEAMQRWPADQPLLMLHSGRLHPRWARWSILASPIGTYRYLATSPTTPSSPRGQSQWLTSTTEFVPDWLPAWKHEPFSDLRVLLNTSRGKGLWIGMLSYDLGRWIERLPSHAVDDRHWPMIELGFCPGYLVYDHLDKHWHACGSWSAEVPINLSIPSGFSQINVAGKPTLTKVNSIHFQTGPCQSVFSRATYETAVQRVIDYIGAGDVFQVNLAQRLSVQVRSLDPLFPRLLYARLASISPAWYGALLEMVPAGDNLPVAGLNLDRRNINSQSNARSVVSTSPELFLQMSPDGKVVTRPIKGTRPAHVNPEELQQSIKDTAELNMIVDLLRNDLGRVCTYGTMKVTEARTIETHPTVHHGVATIAGQLHKGKDVVDLLRAALPGGSITGAPKVRAMEIIDELEPVRRGPYCGCLGYLTADAIELNIAIRTMLLDRTQADSWRVDFSVGGGIVADSQPASEYEETLTKAAALLRALNLSSPNSPDCPGT